MTRLNTNNFLQKRAYHSNWSQRCWQNDPSALPPGSNTPLKSMKGPLFSAKLSVTQFALTIVTFQMWSWKASFQRGHITWDACDRVLEPPGAWTASFWPPLLIIREHVHLNHALLKDGDGHALSGQPLDVALVENDVPALLTLSISWIYSAGRSCRKKTVSIFRRSSGPVAITSANGIKGNISSVNTNLRRLIHWADPRSTTCTNFYFFSF